jgi:hypothetical protein
MTMGHGNAGRFTGKWDVCRCLCSTAGTIFFGLALLLVHPRNASAQVANDSAFQTSPLNASGISAKRAQMISFIWGSAGMPLSKMPSTHKFVPSPVAGLTNLQSVEALRITMDSGQYSIGYHFLPTSNRRNQLVVVHDGHMASNNKCYLDDGPTSGQTDGGIQRTIKALLADGFGVLAITMPEFTPPDPNLPDPGNCTQNHRGMFNLSVNGGNPLKFFVEPVTVALNYLISTVHYPTINMLGLSGGGWTTTLYAALDTRIATSIPIAGTLPLYMIQSNDAPDLEQTLPAFYDPPGVAGYLDIYLLGSRGTGRRQIQILNRHDGCCYNENQTVPSIGFESGIRVYESRLKSVAPGVPGLFRTMIDEVPLNQHMISDHAIQNIILPVLRDTTVAGTLNTTIRSRFGSVGNLCLDIPDMGRPAQNGDYVQVYQCAGGSNQEFALQNDGTVRVPLWGGFCLDVPDMGRLPQNGDQMQIYQCNGGANQQFDLESDGTVRNRRNGICLDVPNMGRDPQNGDRLQVYQCNGGSNQAFSVNKPTTTISSVWSASLCFDVPDMGRPPQNNDLMQVYQCAGGQNQRFNLQTDGTFRTEWGALCLDVPALGRPPANGDRLQVYQCNGGVNQQFDALSDGTIRSRTQGALCLDIPNVGRPPQSGDALQIYQCNGGVNQQFNVNH